MDHNRDIYLGLGVDGDIFLREKRKRIYQSSPTAPNNHSHIHHHSNIHNNNNESVSKGEQFSIDSLLNDTNNTSVNTELHSEILGHENNGEGSPSSKECLRNKRARTIFTPDQLERMEQEFQKQQYVVGPERLYLAASLNLTEAQLVPAIQWQLSKFTGKISISLRVIVPSGTLLLLFPKQLIKNNYVFNLTLLLDGKKNLSN
nr:ventral anterior homeobox 1-like isoform X2 [Lepeophtheirus salmonis]